MGVHLKLAITIEIDVDVVAWGDEYSVRGAAVKTDVGDYFREMVQLSYAAEIGLISDAVLVKIVEKRA